MKQGDKVICRANRGYDFTTGKEYEVVEFHPSCRDPDSGFTWPEYVVVIDDSGRRAICHAHRFTLVEDQA